MSSDALPSELYVPEFAPEWDRHQLHSLAKWVNGMAFKNIDFSPSGTPVVKIAEIKNGVSSQTKFTRATYDPKYFLRDGDMLFCWSGQPETSIDTYWWRGGDGWLNQHIFKVQPKPSDVDVDFFFQLLRYLRPTFVRIARNKQTTGLGHVTKSDLERLTVGIPARAEQLAIARLLGALDDKIESNRRATAVGESLIRALVESALDASERADGTLGDYCRLVKAPVKVEEISADDNYIGLEHMPRGSIFLTEWEKAEGLGSNKTAFQRGDVLFGKLRPYFKKVGIAPVDGVCSTDILAVRPKDPRDIALIAVVAASDALIDSLSAGSTGTRMPRASWKDLAAWQVPILTSTERAELSARVAPLVDRLEQLTFESRRLTALRDALLPELLSGRIRVPAEGIAA